MMLSYLCSAMLTTLFKVVSLTLIHICGVCVDPRKLYQVLLQPFTFQTTVRADPAATKVVRFFVNVYEG